MSAAGTAYPAVDSSKVQRQERRLLTPEGVPLRVTLAEPGERFAAFLLDFVISTVGSILILLAIILGSMGIEATLGLGLFLSFLVRNAYFFFFEIRWGGATPGKRLLGLRVIDRRGGPLTASAIIARNLTRQAEFFFPLELLLISHGWFWSFGSVAPAFIWLAAMAVIFYMSPDRQRAGDLLGGTMVVAVPRSTLVEDVASETRAFEFTTDQLQYYGIKELQVLEDVLRQPFNADSARLKREIGERIQRRIGWKGSFAGRTLEDFLRDFYTAQRAFLETRKNFGDERADKFHQSTRK
jgi:uncharacterized RDD family membrane protein YckC